MALDLLSYVLSSTYALTGTKTTIMTLSYPAGSEASRVTVVPGFDLALNGGVFVGELYVNGSKVPGDVLWGSTARASVTRVFFVEKPAGATTFEIMASAVSGGSGSVFRSNSTCYVSPSPAEGPRGPAGADGAAGAPGAPGVKGDTGATGARGDVGATGARGLPGAQGVKGDPGPAGAAGATGEKGADGAVGAPGPPGTPGATGAPGEPGEDGRDGADGAPGPAGVDGVDGDDGVRGAEGPPGPRGLPGVAGPAGPDGPAGVDGARGPAGEADEDAVRAAVAAYLDTNPPTVTHVPSPTGEDVARFIGKPGSPELVALAGLHVETIARFAHAWTRGNGFTADAVAADVAGVILTATARLVAHPEQIDRQIGSVRVSGGWRGWSLGEQAVLARYRRTAA